MSVVKGLLPFIPVATCLLLALSGLVPLLRLRKSNRFGLLQAAGFVALLVGAIGLWKTGFVIGWMTHPPLEWSDGRAAELEPLIRKHCVAFLNQGRSVGLVVAAVGPSNATIMAFGRPALSGPAPTRGDTMFEIGSITKTFTAIALAREIERGAVRLDQPVQELLPSGMELPNEARAVTLRQLTTHTSGFPRMNVNSSLLLGELNMLFLGGNPYAGYTDATFLDDVRHVKLQSKPGTKSNYSNFGVGLLGYLLATKDGVGYETFIKREVCHPLGMDDTTVTLGDAQNARFAQGYRAMLRFGPVLLALRSDPWRLGSQ
ncbi:MAG TPA: serine hydrolase domain-containing protein, partial [Verrucomicrobiae bacterium]|nr:serine hydrolase domain-containing protein [Verrucomicrobiae bacterium]